jgi:hypothetical protein
MKFIPLGAKDRTHVGSQWTKKFIRSIQSILLATHGLVSPNKEFFFAAFGSNHKEFDTLLWMPEKYIINRVKHSSNGALEWRKDFDKLTALQRKELLGCIHDNKVVELDVTRATSQRLKRLLRHYIVHKQLGR